MVGGGWLGLGVGVGVGVGWALHGAQLVAGRCWCGWFWFLIFIEQILQYLSVHTRIISLFTDSYKHFKDE